MSLSYSLQSAAYHIQETVDPTNMIMVTYYSIYFIFLIVEKWAAKNIDHNNYEK